MDKSTLLGILLGFGALFLGQVWEGGSLYSLLSFPAFLIVVGGTIGAVLIQTPLVVAKRALGQLVWMIKAPLPPLDEGIEKILHWSNISRHDGLLGLENQIMDEPDDFVRKGLTLLVDGAEAEQIRATMDIDMVMQRELQLDASKTYEAMGGYSPTIGIIGAVLGLIEAMNYLSEPERLGVGIATAFVATIYGVGFANFIYLPIANKIRYHIYNQANYQELMVEGLVAVAHGENPRNIEMRLRAFTQQ
ncbi:flagellar motor protein [Echinimonas agarilytica]|uniref:Flagellar motor protein n=1 Tax=Echinimonas agarilytica TaxID=1215918 RepID=A0AA41W5G6_9GAMM|nr:flagellar motor protein [Echinimonas agarilytica]MCM2678989.1 flagellar motor protein [Echinimonas agarilytica]